MNLSDAFAQILRDWKLDVAIGPMILAAEEDPINDSLYYFPEGVAINEIEGRFLYSMVRIFKPKHALEIGCADGASASHILAAMEANGFGVLTSYDTNPKAGSLIPYKYRTGWNLVVADATQVVLPQSDFIFEDAEHDYLTTHLILNQVRKMNPQVIMSHDYFLHWGVRNAWNDLFRRDHTSILFDGTITGLACWFNREH